MIWNKEMETMQRQKLQELQLERLKWTVDLCYNNIPHYRQKLDAVGFKPGMLKSLKDIRHIPFSTKADLRDTYPFGTFGAPMKDIVRVHASSGTTVGLPVVPDAACTTGKPTVVGYTKGDLDNWAEMIARLVTAVGANSDTIVQIAFGYGMFTGAFGLHYGLEKIGATIVPTSTGNSEKQLMFMRDFGTNTLVATPSYALYLSELAKESGYPMSDYKLKLGLFGSEGCTPEMRSQIEQNWGLFATDNYGLSETGGPGLSGECMERNGLHICEDFYYCEVIDPKTGEPVEEGQEGELVVTSLAKKGIPMLRYRTKDITRITYEPCRCGRTTARMAKVTGRTDDMLKIRGVNVFPSQVESVLVGMSNIGPHYQLVVTREGFSDALEVRVELIDERLLEKYSELEALHKSIKQNLRTVLGLEAKVSLVAPKSLERFQGKAKRVIDLRNQSK